MDSSLNLCPSGLGIITSLHASSSHFLIYSLEGQVRIGSEREKPDLHERKVLEELITITDVSTVEVKVSPLHPKRLWR